MSKGEEGSPAMREVIVSDCSEDVASIVESLPPETREVFDDLLAEPLVSFRELREDVEAYRETVREQGHAYEFMDTELAYAIADRYLAVLSETDSSASERDRRLIQAGIRYFTESHDAADDFESPIGFDDDRRVAETILEELDHLGSS